MGRFWCHLCACVLVTSSDTILSKVDARGPAQLLVSVPGWHGGQALSAPGPAAAQPCVLLSPWGCGQAPGTVLGSVPREAPVSETTSRLPWTLLWSAALTRLPLVPLVLPPPTTWRFPGGNWAPCHSQPPRLASGSERACCPGASVSGDKSVNQAVGCAIL